MMKSTLAIFFIFFIVKGYSQDTVVMKQIDVLVSNINASGLYVQRDTIIEDRPAIGLKMTKYLSMIIDGKELMKYTNDMNTIMKQNGVSTGLISSNTFYYCHNKLIKVEEFLIEGDKKSAAEWYYSDGKHLYNTLRSDKAEARAALLLEISNSMIKQIIKE
jgi:hypothetical protein